MIEVIGFLSVDPSLDGSACEPNEFEEMSEVQANNPPPSLIPRLHSISVHTLKHHNPLLVEALSQDTQIDLYKDLHLSLTQCLLGDDMAAQYLLCHLISTVYVRSELQTLGQFSLNISNIPAAVLPGYTSQLYEIIEFLLPASHLLPLTLDNLNILQFAPK